MTEGPHITSVQLWLGGLSPAALSILMAAAATERVFHDGDNSSGLMTVEVRNTEENAAALEELTGTALPVAPPQGWPSEEDGHEWWSPVLTIRRTQFDSTHSVVAWHVGLGMGVLEQIELASGGSND